MDQARAKFKEDERVSKINYEFQSSVILFAFLMYFPPEKESRPM